MEKTLRISGGEYFGPVDGNDMPHGFGKWEAPNGWIYFTEFVHGVMHGDGVIEMPEGDSYYATWVNGMVEGRVEIREKGGGLVEQYYKDGKLISEKRIKY